MIGIPYVWGGTSGNGIDCSGLARLLHKWIGLDLPATLICNIVQQNPLNRHSK